MKRLFTLLTLISLSLLLKSCAGLDTIPLKGKYKNPNSFTFEKSFDNLWDATIKVVVKHGYSIKFLDRSSGVISGDKSNMIDVSTIEDAKGILKDKASYIVSENVYNGYGNVAPNEVNGTWNMLIYKEGTNTVLDINLFPESVLSYGTGANRTTIKLKAVSTGNFEKMIADSLKF